MSWAKRVLPVFLSVSSENLRRALHPIQIDTKHFRFKPRGNPGSQSQDRLVNRTAVTPAYIFGNFLRTLALPKAVGHWSLTTLREKLIKIGAKVVRHGRYITLQLAEVAIPRALFAEILRLIDRLQPALLPP